LWERIPQSYKGGRSYSDFFWEAYSGDLPEEQHEAVSKESGELGTWSAGRTPWASE